MKTTTVGDVMNRRVLTARPAVPLEDLTRVLTGNAALSAIPVPRSTP